jgi:hypothetical protein
MRTSLNYPWLVAVEWSRTPGLIDMRSANSLNGQRNEEPGDAAEGCLDLMAAFSSIKETRLLPGLVLFILITCSLAHISSAADDSLDDSSGMMALISQNEDAKMTARDLAFLLATHGFDAVPKKDYVEVHLGSAAYRLAPNGSNPGLADVTKEI